MLRSKAVLGGLVAATCMSLSSVATARPRVDTGIGIAPLLHGTTHCVKGTPGTFSGIVLVHTSARRNETRVHVVLLRGLPEKTYYVAIACQRYIGSLTTNRRGNGVANIDAPGSTNFPFFVDLGVGDGSQAGTADYRIAGPFTGFQGLGPVALPGPGAAGSPGAGGVGSPGGGGVGSPGFPGLGSLGLPGLGLPGFPGLGLPGLGGPLPWPF